QDFAVVT
ncbi:phenylacetate--CoA ligase domain protein, partial [Vibrio parahaemolyticus AQ3810]